MPKRRHRVRRKPGRRPRWKEETEGFDAYDCKNEVCEGTGGKIGMVFENENEPGPVVQINWPGKLDEGGNGTRLKSTNLRVLVRCQFAHIAPLQEEVSEGPFAGLTKRTTIEYDTASATTCTTKSPATSEPRETNGSSPGKPSKTEFGAGSGELECGAEGKGEIGGKLKTVGYNGSELLTVGPTTRIATPFVELEPLGGTRRGNGVLFGNKETIEIALRNVGTAGTVLEKGDILPSENNFLLNEPGPVKEPCGAFPVNLPSGEARAGRKSKRVLHRDHVQRERRRSALRPHIRQSRKKSPYRAARIGAERTGARRDPHAPRMRGAVRRAGRGG
jgi:hypothetical protein